MHSLIYNLFLHTVAAPLLAAYYLPQVILRGKYRRSLRGKLGQLPENLTPEALPRPRVWFHAVSVGEVVALSPLLNSFKEFLPTASFIISTGTETGQDKARDLITGAQGFLYLPLDFPSFVNPVVDRISPDLFVMMETELWPNLIRSLKKRGAVIALANGRISDRSFPRYHKLRGFFAPTLQGIDLFLMSSEIDASRIEELGVTTEKIHVTGNTKFDAALTETPPEAEERMRELLGIEAGTRTLVAGSTHSGEHEIVLAAYEELTKTFPDLVLILVPRHVEKTPLILSHMKERGMAAPFLRSMADRGETREDRNIVIVDRTGELFQVFSVATAVFMGGSLVPRGGQNILEPAAWGKVVLFGPSMEDFRDARDILARTGAGIQVRGKEDLTRRVAELLNHPEKTLELGRKGRDALLKHLGSARKNALLLAALLSPRTRIV